jgi:hypothetical protein
MTPLPTKPVQSFEKRYAPATDEERNLVQSLADTEWRLLRIPSLEMGIYAIGRLELASNFQNEADPQARAALLNAQVFLTYQRQLNNLSIQEGRLLRLRDKTRAELERLLRLRLARPNETRQSGSAAYSSALIPNRSSQTSELGFEFPAAPLTALLVPECRRTSLNNEVHARRLCAELHTSPRQTNKFSNLDLSINALAK